ncbi:hypothetical protein [Bacillus mycoides]|uniref:hypothetical protein n=2 Tax=Bacillaceae TaxID=186817 RepID=UPI001C3F2190|nr:hypothetical protein [Bacillus mycoides]MCU5545543.1 hypothetical protein [Bacillus cereus]WOA60987.1 hypothetical protein RVY74_31625 [Bacillus mycoides]
MSRDGEKMVKKLYVLIVAAILLLTLVNSSLGKMETQQYSQKAKSSGNQYMVYRMMVDPGGGG